MACTLAPLKQLAPHRNCDLVLPERQLDLLRSISAYLRHRDQVLSEWGYEVTVSRTQGLKVLFAGESGTGKTMGAQVIAAELGLEIFRVDLATTVSSPGTNVILQPVMSIPTLENVNVTGTDGSRDEETCWTPRSRKSYPSILVEGPSTSHAAQAPLRTTCWRLSP